MAYDGSVIYISGASINIQFSASGGTPPYTWEFSPETVVPSGLTIDAAGLVSGVVADGVYPITVIASDTIGQVGVDFVAIYVGVAPLGLPDTLPDMCSPSSYSYTLPVTGGVPPYTTTLFAGTLPVGISLSESGLLSGMPSIPGTYTFTLRVVDSAV